MSGVPENPPVVLVHGYTSSFDRGWQQTGWADLLEDEDRTVVGVDLLGHGDAPKPHDPAAYADVGARVVAALPDSVVDGVGFSLGAVVLLDVAARHPERFRRLAVMGIGANLFRPRDPDDPLRQAFARFATNEGNDPVALAAFRQRPVPPIDFARITCPVLIVLGERDTNGPADPLAEALVKATVTMKTVRGADHLGTPTDFGAIEAVLSFLAR
jgi:pimeloyl-ACP methyl ester carboxylesterase